jgi:hypothetical protein
MLWQKHNENKEKLLITFSIIRFVDNSVRVQLPEITTSRFAVH